MTSVVEGKMGLHSRKGSMLEKATRKELVLLQTTAGLYLGLVCFHHGFESLNFVLEKREFFDFEWPAFVAADSGGLRPVLLGLEHIVVQRQHHQGISQKAGEYRRSYSRMVFLQAEDINRRRSDVSAGRQGDTHHQVKTDPDMPDSFCKILFENRKSAEVIGLYFNDPALFAEYFLHIWGIL